MIIKAKPLSPAAFRFISWLIRGFISRRFNKISHTTLEIKTGYSYLVMSNHFSFWDGIFAFYLCNELIRKKAGTGYLYVMVLEKQIRMNWWLRYSGAFSVAPGRSSISESLDYAADILNVPGNMLIMFPQGNLESLYVRNIIIKEGIPEIMVRTTGNCQLIWSSTLVEYMESLKPSLTFNLLDCGTSQQFDFNILSRNINDFHLKTIRSHFRFTTE